MKIQQLFIQFGRRQENISLEGEKKILVHLFKVYNKVEMSTKKMFFSFSFWVEFIQRIEQKT